MIAMALMRYALLPCDKIGTVVREKLHGGAMCMMVRYRRWRDLDCGAMWIVVRFGLWRDLNCDVIWIVV